MLKHLLNSTCTIQEVEKTSDAYGSYYERWTDKYTDISCAWQPLSRVTRKSGGEETVYGKEQTTVTGTMYLSSFDFDISEENRVIIKNQCYDVIYVRDECGLAHHYAVDLEAIKPDI